MLEALVSPVLVGRTREVEFLDHALRAARNGAGRSVFLAGEAGIGKSRLVAELRSRAATGQFIIWQGHCFEQDVAFPYAPWIDAVRAFLAPKSTGEATELLGSLSSELVKLLPELSLLDPAIQPTPPLGPEAEKHRLFESLARLGASLSAAHPLLVILEDLHWSDESSLDLLHFFARRIAALPILLVGTYRAEELPLRLRRHLDQLTRDRLVDELSLGPLQRSEVEQMARAILRADAIAADWLDILMSLTEGNPFFVEEIVKTLPEMGRLNGFQIPRSIQDVVQRRAEHLPGRTRQILLFAAVIGERFDFGLVQEIAGEDEPSLLRMLKELVAAQLIVEQSADQFAFRHALTREAVYATLMLRERKAMHRTIGETIERLTGAREDAPAAQLAYHFYQAGEWQKAMEYSQRAGERAQGLYAPREALAHFSHALNAAQQLGVQTPRPSLRGRAQARQVLGDFDGARADYEALIGLARRVEDGYGEWQALIDLGLLWQSRDLRRAGDYYQQALESARTRDDASVLARSLNRVANYYYFRGRPLEALPLQREALGIFQRLADRRGVAETLELLGLVSYGMGDMIQGAAYYEQAIPLLRELDDRQGLVHSLGYLSLRARFDTEVLGQVVLSQLASQGEMAFQIAHGFDWREGEGEALSRAGTCWSRTGDYTRGLELMQRAQLLGEEIEQRHLLTSVHLNLGELYLGLLALDQARDHLERALALAQDVGAILLLGSVPPPLVSTCILQGDLSRAKAVLALLSLTGDPAEIERAGVRERRVWSAQAELELALGHPERASEIVNRLIASAGNVDRYGPHAVPWLSQLRAQALAALGRSQDAAAELTGAQAIARARGALPLLWRLHADLGKVYRAMGRRDDAKREFSSARSIIQDLGSRVPEGALREDFLRQALATIPAVHVPTPRQAAKKEFGGLTAREREIAALIAQGKSNREMADDLVISEKTAERHVANILSKLGFGSRTQIAAWAVAKRLDK